MKKFRKLQSGSLTSRVEVGMKDGAKLTLGEWAVKEKTTYAQIHQAFNALRKRGYFYRPYPGIMKVKGHSKRGVMVDFTKKDQWFADCVGTYRKNYSEPTLAEGFRSIEGGIEENPTRLTEAQDFGDNIQIMLIEHRRKLKAFEAEDKLRLETKNK